MRSDAAAPWAPKPGRMALFWRIWPPRRHFPPIWALVAVLVFAGCGEDAATTNNTTATQPKHTGAAHPPAETDRAPKLHPPPCPPGVDPCVRAAGTILYVERVDPDGDGDAHFVLADSRGVTGPGITVLDVRTDLRPH